MVKIIEASTPEQYEVAGALFKEYAAALPFTLDFQQFEKELIQLPDEYGPPGGCLLLAVTVLETGTTSAAASPAAPRTLGCVGVRPLGEGICEMKRLYVRPSGRGQGLGRRLAEAAVAHARQLGYGRIRLDTVEWMKEANALYASLGFRRIGSYRHNPLDDALFFEKVL